MIDIQKFCSGPYDCRYHLCKPFQTKSGIVATNGHILVCIHDDAREVDNKDIKADLVDRVDKWLAEVVVGESIDMANVKLLPPLLCSKCDGAKKEIIPLIEKCSECHGRGVQECDMGHDHECPECKGVGTFTPDDAGKTVNCDRCEGAGEEGNIHIDVNGVWLQLKYLRLMSELPDCKIFVNKEKPTDMQHFTFSGGRGILVAMRAPNEIESMRQDEMYKKHYPDLVL